VQVTFEKTGPCEAKVSFTVPRADFDREYRAALKASGKNVRMKGFRAGKVPTAILEKEFGEKVQQKAIEFFLNKAFSQAVEENELKPVGHERVSFEDVVLEEGADLEHHFNISLKPEFELGEYKGLEVTDETEQVTNEEIEEAIDDLRMQRSTPEPAGDEGLAEDGMAVCHIVWEREGESILDKDEVRLTSLTPLPGTDADAFKEAMVGTKSGDVFQIDLVVPADFQPAEHQGATVDCKITINEAFAMVPPPEDELWRLLDVENADAFRHVCRERLEIAKKSQEHARQETELVERLIAAHTFDLPEAMVEAQMEGRRQAIRQQLEQAGAPEEELEAQTSEQTESNREATMKALTALFLIGDIAEREGIVVEEQDMIEEMQQRAAKHQAKVEEVVKYYQEHGLLQQVQVELLERKVRVFMRENAKITEP
jgi:trigger factor